MLISDRYWLIATVWQEARGESFDGKVGVAEAIIERKGTRYMSDGTYAGTVLRAWQFSGWNTGDPNRIKAAKLDEDDPVVNECIRAVEVAEAGSNLTNGARHYYNPSVCSPKWAVGAEVLAAIGNHLFVRPKEA